MEGYSFVKKWEDKFSKLEDFIRIPLIIGMSFIKSNTIDYYFYENSNEFDQETIFKTINTDIDTEFHAIIIPEKGIFIVKVLDTLLPFLPFLKINYAEKLGQIWYDLPEKTLDKYLRNKEDVNPEEIIETFEEYMTAFCQKPDNKQTYNIYVNIYNDEYPVFLFYCDISDEHLIKDFYNKLKKTYTVI